jgi:hypothetical protein
MNTIDRDPNSYAPVEGCQCKICFWCRYGYMPEDEETSLPQRLVRPADPEWETLLRLSARVRA